MKKIFLIALAALALPLANVAQAAVVEYNAEDIGFNTFKIRNNDGSIIAPWDLDLTITENGTGNGFSAATPRSGQKVGYGTSYFDGWKVNELVSVSFDRGTGIPGAKIPYLNFWVTDGSNYAILAQGGDYRGNDLKDTASNWLIYEFNAADISWLFDAPAVASLFGSNGLRVDGNMVKLSDLSDNVVFGDPGSPYPGYVGTGAPRNGNGLNVIWGDTLSNYTGPMEISNLKVTYNKVPEPAPLALLGLGLLGLGLARKRRQK